MRKIWQNCWQNHPNARVKHKFNWMDIVSAENSGVIYTIMTNHCCFSVYLDKFKVKNMGQKCPLCDMHILPDQNTYGWNAPETKT